ncbi:MAG: class I SAM-dependent methyltransferase [Bacteroidota bacterium]
MDLAARYFLRPGAAFVRGSLEIDVPHQELELHVLTVDQQVETFQFGLDQSMKMHKFKRTMGLPRVQRVLGILQGLQPSNLLDVGTGRGVFLWPFLDTFPDIPVQCIDVLDYRVADLQAIQKGGWNNLSADQLDVTNLPFEENQFEVTTALEVLEHIPAFESAVAELIRVTRRFLIISVPSKEDDNPEHIHLLDQTVFRNLFSRLGIDGVKFDYVLNHMIIVANLQPR